MQATRGKTTRVSQDIEQQNMTVPAKRRTGLSADIAEVCISPTFSKSLSQHSLAGKLLVAVVATAECTSYCRVQNVK